MLVHTTPLCDPTDIRLEQKPIGNLANHDIGGSIEAAKKKPSFVPGGKRATGARRRAVEHPLILILILLLLPLPRQTRRNAV